MAWTNRFSDFNNVKCNDYRNFKYPGSNNSKMLNVSRLEDVHAGLTNLTVTGIILSKDTPRSIQSKKSPGTERFLLNFVLRDAPTFFVNVTCWGSEHFIKNVAGKFAITDIVQLSNVQIQQKSNDGYEEKFRPCTPVSYNIVFSENHSQIDYYTGPDTESFRNLQHIPVKASNDYYTLEDILANGQNLSGEHINLLAVVKRVGQAKDITTKTGKKTRRCELKLLDETCSSFALILWDSDIIDIALTWTAFSTVLFVADVRVSYDDFRSCMISTADSKTIFTVNPDTLEAHSLYQFARSQTFDEEENSRTTSDPALETIKNIYTVSEIIDMKNERADVWKPTVYGIAYIYISHFDVDGDDKKVLRYRCHKCRHTITEGTDFTCSNPECGFDVLNNVEGPDNNIPPLIEYSLSTSWSDHTGTVDFCHLDGDVAEGVIGIKADRFAGLPLAKKTQIKWTYLLERCKVYFKVTRTIGETGKVFLRTLSCRPVDFAELENVLQ